MTLLEQTIVLLGSATNFAVVCQACETHQLAVAEEQPPVIRGVLAAGRDLGWTECPRGHRVRAIRAGRGVHAELTSPLW